MYKKLIYLSICTFISPMSLHALGLGEMKVESSLNQAFHAEIELVDTNGVGLPDIRVGLADADNFKRVGIQLVPALDLLEFKVQRNHHGKLVILVSSQDRIDDPYMQLIVDLAWPHGQLFKVYTVLLDPPGYKLAATKVQSKRLYYKNSKSYTKEPGVINKEVISSVSHSSPKINDEKTSATYGPTVDNENVWQIAQRYKTSEVSLPQVVLAIVGSNPEDFTDGNLNGMKKGVRLVIPSTNEIQKISAELATEEVMAHDQAWNDKTIINHVITPPYMGVDKQIPLQENPESVIPSIPKVIHLVEPPPSSLNPQTSLLVPMNAVVPAPVYKEQDALTKAQLAITTAAVESMREAHALMVEQFKRAQAENKKLQKLLNNRDQELAKIKTQLQLLTKERHAVAAQTSSSVPNDKEQSSWTYLLILLMAAGSGIWGLWYYQLPKAQDKKEEAPKEPIKKSLPQLPDLEQEPAVVEKPEPEAVEDEVTLLIPKPQVDSEEEHVLEFEPGLYKSEANAAPVKSSQAFDTLLSLAKTYIDAKDVGSATNALNEVLQYGTQAQKDEAQSLLDKLKS
ncbi:MAG: FimV/HubP family polar landmark protein [Legionella sp.]